MKTRISIGLCLITLALQFAYAADGFTDAGIKAILRERIDVARKSVGIVVGLVDERGSKVISHGRFGRDDDRTVNGDTVFEIGSFTKFSTTLLLQDMIERGEMKLDDPVAKYLPASVKMPVRDGKEITLLHLATHTSALPRMPGNFRPKDRSNPYSDYTVAQMYGFLASCKLRREIGAKGEYSNLGVALLGHAISLKAGIPYESLVVERICQPLRMESTRITLGSLKARFAPGHSENGEPAANWDLPTFAGAGALRSTANDLLKFLSANVGLTETPLTARMRKTHETRFQSSPDQHTALGWHVNHRYGTDIIWHNGKTAGYHSFVGFAPKTRSGVVVLSNSANTIEDIGLHLLEVHYKLATYPSAKERKVANIDPALYAAYEGRYEMNPDVFFTVRRDKDRLMVQLTGQEEFEVFPESKTEFFYKVVDARLTFVKNEAGEVFALILHQNGGHPAAMKVK